MKDKKVLILFFVLLLFSYSCEQERITYYENKNNTEESIYQILKKDGRFTYYIKALDLTEFAALLDNTGSFTAFPPTDDAFTAYLSERSKSFESLSKEELREIVAYSFTDFALPSQYLTTKSEWGFWSRENNAFRKKTRYSVPVYDEDVYKVISEPKYLLLFTNDYFSAVGGSGKEAETYNYFYPNTAWNKNSLGVNVVNANVVEADIPAKNGFIYIVDKVLTPPANIAEIISEKPQYNEFGGLFQKFKEFVFSQSETERRNSSVDLYFKKLTGSMPRELNTPVAELEVDINEENVRGSYTMQAPTYSSHTIFVPSNAALAAHLNKYTGEPSRPALRHLLNGHLIKELIQYPSHLKADKGPYKYLFDGGKVTGGELASNGAIYYVNEVVESNVFKGVAGPIFFNNNYSTLMYALEKSNQTLQLSDGTSIFHLLVLDNAYFEAEKITYEPSLDVFYKDGKVWSDVDGPKATSKDKVAEFVNQLIVKGALKGGFGKASTGEYFYFDDANKKIISDNQTIDYTESYTSADGTGKGFYIDKIFAPQQQYDAFFNESYKKFRNLLNLANILLYEDYTVFVLPDSEINYDTPPFDMIGADGKLKGENAVQRLLEVVNQYIVPDPLFTKDADAHKTHNTKNELAPIQFQETQIIDKNGNAITITKPDITKSGVIIHEINSLINN